VSGSDHLGLPVLRIPDPAPFCLLDPEWVKNEDQDPGLGSEMNVLDHFSESLETIFWLKNTSILKCGSGIFLTLDPGSGMEKIQIRDKNPGSATLVYWIAYCLSSCCSLPDVFYSTKYRCVGFGSIRITWCFLTQHHPRTVWLTLKHSAFLRVETKYRMLHFSSEFGLDPDTRFWWPKFKKTAVKKI